jgi:NAD(P)-dependent dehydrogenase (short-subunit alcohol dehydrogenase family)
MAREAAGVVICDINPKTLPRARAEVEAAGVRSLAMECDVPSGGSVAELFRETVSTFGTLDVLVNDAARVQSGACDEEMRPEF